jgi:hypothetical protein
MTSAHPFSCGDLNLHPGSLSLRSVQHFSARFRLRALSV